MLKFLKQDNNTKRDIFINVSKKLKIQPEYIEKDFWVCLILYILFTKSDYKNDIVFGGGTSLSKCYGVIKRFSEDIDIAINWDKMGFDTNPNEGKSKTQRKLIVEKVRNSTLQFIKNKLLLDIKEKIKNVLGLSLNVHIDEHYPDTIMVEYPKFFESNYILPVVKIEVGSVSSSFLRQSKIIKSYLSDVYPNIFELSEVKIPTTLISRIFWDKAMVLHRIANMPEDKKTPYRYARHYYDLYFLAKNKEVKHDALNDQNILKLAVDENTEFYRCNWAHYEDCLNKKFKLIPSNKRILELKKDYEQMKTMVFGDIPSFDEIITSLSKLEKEINKD